MAQLAEELGGISGPCVFYFAAHPDVADESGACYLCWDEKARAWVFCDNVREYVRLNSDGTINCDKTAVSAPDRVFKILAEFANNARAQCELPREAIP